MNRRTFLASSAAAALGATFLRHSSAYAATASLSARPTPGGPLVTPNGQFFLYSQMRYPATLPQAVEVDGLVATPTRFSLDDLAHVPPVKKLLTLECFVNTAGGPLIFTTPFEGAPLSALFEKAGIKPEAKAARVECSDGHPPFLLPLAELQRPETMLVAKHGNDAVPMQHGNPYTRLFIPGAGGNHHPKWVSRITLVANDAPSARRAADGRLHVPAADRARQHERRHAHRLRLQRPGAGRQGRTVHRQRRDLPRHAAAAAARSEFLDHLGGDLASAGTGLLRAAREGHQRRAAASRTSPARSPWRCADGALPRRTARHAAALADPGGSVLRHHAGRDRPRPPSGAGARRRMAGADAGGVAARCR